MRPLVILGFLAVTAGAYTWLTRPVQVVHIDKSRIGQSQEDDHPSKSGSTMNSRAASGEVDDPDAYVDDLIAGSEAAEALGVVSANFLTPDWKPETIAQFLRKNKEFILDGELNQDPELRRMMDQDTAGMIVVKNGPDGIVPITSFSGKKE